MCTTAVQVLCNNLQHHCLGRKQFLFWSCLVVSKGVAVSKGVVVSKGGFASKMILGITRNCSYETFQLFANIFCLTLNFLAEIHNDCIFLDFGQQRLLPYSRQSTFGKHKPSLVVAEKSFLPAFSTPFSVQDSLACAKLFHFFETMAPCFRWPR